MLHHINPEVQTQNKREANEQAQTKDTKMYTTQKQTIIIASTYLLK